MMDQLMERGYNEGAARWIAEQIEAGNGTLDQYLFSALDLRKVEKRNAEHKGYTGREPKEEPETVVVSTKVRPAGSYSNYIAYGHVKADGSFQREGYPKDILKPVYGESWGKRGGNQYEYEITLNVPTRFPFYIVQVYNQSAVQNKSIKVLFSPKEE